MLRVVMERHRKDRLAGWAAVAAVVAWMLANALDVLSMLLYLQMGGTWPPVARRHPAAFLVIYATMRVLLAIAAWLGTLLASRLYPLATRAAWGTLTVCSLATVVAAWWRLLAGR